MYSYRPAFQVKPLFDAFTRESGIHVDVVHAWGSDAVDRIREEGRDSPADVIFNHDLSAFQAAVDAGVVQGVRSDLLERNVPAAYRHPDGLWYALTLRTRLLAASKERVPRGSLRTYEALAEETWRGRICTRSSRHHFNLGLMASMIAHHGEPAAELWARDLLANLAMEPQGNDRDQVRAIMDGKCDVTPLNHYYVPVMQRDEEQSAWADAVYLIFPNQDDRGAHLNMSGAAVAKHAPNLRNAVELMEFLTGEMGQRLYAEMINGYPVRPGTPTPAVLESWGSFRMDTLPLVEVGEKLQKAVELFERVEFP